MPTYQDAKRAGHWAAIDAITEEADRISRADWRAFCGINLRRSGVVR